MPPWLIFALILVIAGLAGILSIVYKKIPTLLNLPDEAAGGIFGEGFNFQKEIKRRLETIKYFSYQPKILQWLEKILRKSRVIILKTDNLFIAWIARAREKSQIWTVRSRVWMEHRRLKKKEKTRLLEHLDKMEISQELEKMKQAAAKDEDEALKEKIETVKNGNGAHPEEEKSPEISTPDFSAAGAENAKNVNEEKICIDAIAENPKDVKAYKDLGFLYLGQKNYKDARACFRQALKLDPENEEVKKKLEEIQALKSKNGNGDEKITE